MTKTGPDSGLKTLADYKAALKSLVERTDEYNNNHQGGFVQQSDFGDFGSFCHVFGQQWGIPALAEAITEVATTGNGPLRALTASQLILLLDDLRGPSSTSFPINLLIPLLAELPVNWHSMSGADLGELFASLLLFAKAQSNPADVGQALSHVFTRASFVPTPQIIAASVRFLWEEGFAWGQGPGALLSTLLDDRWKLTQVPALVCCLVQGCLDCEELDLMDFDSLDSLENDAHNPAIRIGGLLDALILPKGCELALCANIVRAFIATFGNANRPNGSEVGPNVHPPRADIFIGRVLQQLSFAHESYGPDAAESQHIWKLSAATGLACSLCAGPQDNFSYDWRQDRQQHAYCVGEILRELRPRWPHEDVSMLIEALKIPPASVCYSTGPMGAGGPGVPTRIIAEVVEGLAASKQLLVPERKNEYYKNIKRLETVQGMKVMSPPLKEKLESESVSTNYIVAPSE